MKAGEREGRRWKEWERGDVNELQLERKLNGSKEKKERGNGM